MPSALSQRDSMPNESPRPGQESGRTAPYRRATSLPAVGVPGFARRSLLSASAGPATAIRTLAIAVPDGAGKPGRGGDLAGT
jgi:hypothetical protein